MFKIDGKKYQKILEYFVSNKSNSLSQKFQDLLVLYFSEFKKDGYFIDIGAADGVVFNNTFILEKRGWNGIVSEPLEVCRNKLNERNCIKDFRCVYEKSNLSLNFSYIKDFPMVSGITEDFEEDNNQKFRINSNNFEIKTVSLNDLLKEKNAPQQIDYISIDTEGSEYKILKSFDFINYNVGIFTVEHNYIVEKRNKIANLMKDKGYLRVFVNLSGQDDWYIKSDNKVLKDISI